MTISPELAMVDTNVLVYAYYEDTPAYPPPARRVSPPRPYPGGRGGSLDEPRGVCRVLCGDYQSPTRQHPLYPGRSARRTREDSSPPWLDTPAGAVGRG